MLAIIVLILIRPQSPVSKISFKVEQIKLIDSFQKMEIILSTQTDIAFLVKKFKGITYYYTCSLKNKLPSDTLLLLEGFFPEIGDDRNFHKHYNKAGDTYYYKTIANIENIDMNKTDLTSAYILENYELGNLKCIPVMYCFAFRSLLYQNYNSKPFTLNLDTIKWKNVEE